MRQTVTLGRLFDIRVGIHASWILVYAVMSMSIAAEIDGVPRGLAFALASLCALLLFASVIAHELAHALVARRFGVRTRAITLFLFGGVATLECEPPTPRAEVAIALAGPAMSALLAAFAFGGLMVLERTTGGVFADALGVVAEYLALANGVLAVFNLIPAYPMDGGRVLRAAVWKIRRSRVAATGAASLVGLALASALVVIGTSEVVVRHEWRDGWYALIGAFVLRQSWRQFADSRSLERLERLRVRDLMDAAGEGELPLDGFALASTASGLDAVSAFRACARTEIAVVEAGRLAGWLHREQTLALAKPAA